MDLELGKFRCDVYNSRVMRTALISLALVPAVLLFVSCAIEQPPTGAPTPRELADPTPKPQEVPSETIEVVEPSNQDNQPPTPVLASSPLAVSTQNPQGVPSEPNETGQPLGLQDPTPTPTVKAVPTPVHEEVPPKPHELGQPKGLGVRRITIHALFEKAGYDFEMGEIRGRPLLKGFSTLGNHAIINLVGVEYALTWVHMDMRWTDDDVSKIRHVADLAELATPKWNDARTWVNENAPLVRASGEEARMAYGNYVLSLEFLDGVSPTLAFNARARYASCEDALEAKEFVFKGSVGAERGYSQWKVPSAPDDDGDNIVCEGGLPLIPR